MLLLIILSCVIFQTTITIYLFNVNKTGDSFEKNLTRILVLLLLHLCTKFFLLVGLKNEHLYGKVAFGFGLAYGPMLYIVVCAFSGKAMARRNALLHLTPFFAASVTYMALITGSVLKNINDNFIINYTAIFQWFVVASLLTYSFLVKNVLARTLVTDAHDKGVEKTKWKLLNNISTTLAFGILAGVFFELTQVIKSPIPNFHLRFLPYMCFAVIPVLILRYKLEPSFIMPEVFGRKNEKATMPDPVAQQSHLPAAVANQPAATVSTHPSPAKRYEKSSLDEAAMDSYQQALKKYVESSKIFLNAELSLEELAQQVKIPKHHLTQLLNDRLGKNFYNYINEYRVQEAIIRLKNMQEEVNILSLAYDCGFNSKSSFNNYFKKVTQHTPSSYRKMVENSSEPNTNLAT